VEKPANLGKEPPVKKLKMRQQNTATIKVGKANGPETRLDLSPTSKKDGCWKANWQEVAAKKIQLIFSDLIMAACSPGTVTPLMSSSLHFGKNLGMNFR
jgi:hypothetical protein